MGGFEWHGGTEAGVVPLLPSTDSLIAMRKLVWLAILANLATACASTSVASTSQPVVLPTTTTTSTTTTTTPKSPPSTSPPTTVALPPLQGLELETVASGLTELVAVATDPANDVLLAVERRGVIHAIGVGVALDISDRVRSRDREQGLLGLAFHPEDSDRLYLNYINRSGDSVVSEFRRRDGSFDAGSERIVLEVDQPASNHNGGHLEFGPDGFLYIGLGDGGGANDNFDNGQDPSSLLGSIVRIDPLLTDGEPFGVPSDNPFVGNVLANPLVWAYGLRNPWRYTFDSELMYVADVGQRRWEEVTVVPVDGPGEALNFGWPILEGTSCFSGGDSCARGGLVEPIVEYSHDEGCSISGGVVMHDPAIPEFDGFYLYGDFCNGWVRALHYDGTSLLSDDELFSEVGSIASFGVDADGAALVVTLEGSIERIVAVRADG